MKIAYFFVSFFQEIGLQSIKHLTMQRETEANISITYMYVHKMKYLFLAGKKKEVMYTGSWNFLPTYNRLQVLLDL